MKKITTYDPESKSQDLIHENIEKLKSLFPEIVSEGEIDFEVLKEILGEEVIEEEEYYKFTWAGKAQARREANKPSTGTLRPDKDESVNWDKTQNLYIEGDNLEVLKLMQKTYAGKVKMIYIDPPYNTGSDFVYKDNYKDNLKNYQELTGQVDDEGRKMTTNTESRGRYHSNWLNMMYPRLRLARNLLSDDSVIFMSIDDHEIENLKKISNEIFGENNLIGMFSIRSTPNARDYGHIGKMHEYCLFYSKKHNLTETYHLPDFNKKFKYADDLGKFNIHPLYNSNEAFNIENRPNLYYPFFIYLGEEKDTNGFFKIGLESKENSIEIYPPLSNENGIQFVWRWGKDKSLKNLNKEIVGYKTSENEYRIVQKMRTSKKVIRSIFDKKSVSSRRGTAEVEKLFKRKIFSFPKPLNLILDFLKASTINNDIVLDFFSGSGTTAHAVMALNAEDGGNRRHIQVQLPEPTDQKSEAYKAGYETLTEIGKERIRRAGNQILKELDEQIEKKQNKLDKLKEKGDDEDKIESLTIDINEIKERKDKLDIGFKVFKLDSSNIKAWSARTENLKENLLSPA